MSEIFENFEIFGIPDSTEDAILACLLQGDPGLLIGPPGTAKTEILECIALAFHENSKKQNPTDPSKWFKYKLYDASKLNPEDLMGYPDPKSIMEGKMDFIKLPSSVWDKNMLVFDEINRCEKSRQSNLFEIVRSRRLMGIKLPSTFIFSSMNPFGDTGTNEMSDALSDRHLFFLWFTGFGDMKTPDQMKIMNRMGTHEGVGVRYWDKNRKFNLDVNDDEVNEKFAKAGQTIEDIMVQAVNIFDKLNEDLGDKINKLTIRIADCLAQEKAKDPKIGYVDVNGRRANMIRRGILSMRAVQQAKNAVLGITPPPLQGCLTNAIQMLLPIGVGTKVDANTIVRIKKLIETTVNVSYPAIFSNDVHADSIYSILNEKNPALKLYGLLSVNNLNAVLSTKLWSELYEASKDTELEYTLVLLNQAIPGCVPAHINLNTACTKSEDSKEMRVSIPKNFGPHKQMIEGMYKSLSDNKMLFGAAKGAIAYLTTRHPDADQAETLSLVASLNNLISRIKTLYDLKVTNANVPVEASSTDTEQ